MINISCLILIRTTSSAFIIHSMYQSSPLLFHYFQCLLPRLIQVFYEPLLPLLLVFEQFRMKHSLLVQFLRLRFSFCLGGFLGRGSEIELISLLLVDQFIVATSEPLLHKRLGFYSKDCSFPFQLVGYSNINLILSFGNFLRLSRTRFPGVPAADVPRRHLDTSGTRWRPVA